MSKAVTAVDNRYSRACARSVPACKCEDESSVNAPIRIPAGAHPDEDRGRYDAWFCNDQPLHRRNLDQTKTLPRTGIGLGLTKIEKRDKRRKTTGELSEDEIESRHHL
jgi:hypothetical protein